MITDLLATHLQILSETLVVTVMPRSMETAAFAILTYSYFRRI